MPANKSFSFGITTGFKEQTEKQNNGSSNVAENAAADAVALKENAPVQ